MQATAARCSRNLSRVMLRETAQQEATGATENDYFHY